MTPIHEHDIAIIGMNCRFPGIDGTDEFERLLRDGSNILKPRVVSRDGERQIELASVLPHTFAFDAEFFGYAPGEARLIDPQHRVFLECSWHLLEQAGYPPRRVRVPVGVFAGASTSFYLLHYLWNTPEILRVGNDLQVMVGNDKDHLTARVAYELDLQGPCLTIQASCATSLVAVHVACESLLGQQCDLALAGGVSLRMPAQRSYFPRNDGLLSEDGHVHAFDASASGTAYSSGVAVVLLKRALDAVRDGDHIWALIGGTAVNNDGAQRAGYTAPGVEGQSRVIIEAQRVAGVSPADVAMVEAHGSGTLLGDPIEFEALRRAFLRDGLLPPAHCAIGSVKTNIGHVEMAAGAAGLIKASLSIHNKRIYPSLGYTTPNPALSIADSPFFVNTLLSQWPSDRARIAGVSAFGLGGTNAHAILREAPDRPRRGSRCSPEVLLLSAQDERALGAAEEALVPVLSNSAIELSDICHTLQVGRLPASHRKAVVVEKVAAAAAQLVASAPHRAQERPLVWLLGSTLCLAKDAVEAALQVCPDEGERAARLLGGEPRQAGTRLNNLPEPERTFLGQYLLGSLLTTCGIKPQCLLWEGVGEYAASVLAGCIPVEASWRQMHGGDREPAGLPRVPLCPLAPGGSRYAELNDILARHDLRGVRLLAIGTSMEAQDPRSPAIACIVPSGGELSWTDVLALAAALWRDGQPVEWERLRVGAPAFRVPLPGTPFRRVDHYVPMLAPASPSVQPIVPDAARQVGEVVREVWEAVLGITSPDPLASIFELGGHSLLAIQLLQELRVRLRVGIPMVRFFAEPTLAGLTRAAEALLQAECPSIDAIQTVTDPTALHEPFPLTDVQQAYWVGRLASLELGNIATHIYLEFEFPALDLDRFEEAVNGVIARHPMLRAVILADGSQQILEQTPRFRVSVAAPGARNAPAFAEAIAERRERLSHRVPDCSKWPLFSMEVLRADEGAAYLHASFDLLVADAWSLELFLRDLSTSYHQPTQALPAISFTFRDYVVSLRRFESTPAYERARAYWEERVKDLPPGPALPLRADPSDIRTPKFTRRARMLRPAVWRRLATSAGAHELTPTVILLTAFSEVLARWSAEPRFTLNLTLFNRPSIHPQIHDVIGDFTELTLLEVDASTQGGFAERALALQARLWEDLDHRAYSGVKVARLRASVHGVTGAVMPVVFTSLLNQPEHAWGDWSVPVEAGYGVSQTPQVWLDHQVRERNGALLLTWDTVEQIFDATLLDEMFEAYVGLLEALSKEPVRWQQQRVLHLPPVAAPVPRAPLPTGGLHLGLLQQAQQTPEAVAVIQGLRTFSYAQLDHACNWVARSLAISPGQRVAVLVHPGWALVAAAHGVMRAGGVYVPLDPSWPSGRLRLLLQQSQVACVLTEPDLRGALDLDTRVVVLQEAWLSQPAPPSAPGLGSDSDVAYIIFTSGSTGQPKGVMIEHRAANNTIEDINARFAVSSADRLLSVSSCTFDLSIYDLFGPLRCGGTLVYPEPGREKDPRHWSELIRAHHVSIWNGVPALLQLLVAEQAEAQECTPTLRLALVSGDWIPVDLPGDAKKRLSAKMDVVSLGGATECSIWSVIHIIKEGEPRGSRIPYGVGMTNQPVYVKDPAQQERPVGVVGEIYIAGAGLARGYLNDEEKTAQRFVRDPDSGEREYRTGDLGRYRRDGSIEILGRMDRQVKVKGVRIELGEVEHALLKLPGVSQAVVVPAGSDSARHLAGFVVPASRPMAVEPQPQGAVLEDPAERLAFKVARKGLRRLKGEVVRLDSRAEPDTFILRRSYRNFEARTVTLGQLGGLLSCLAEREFRSLPFPKRRYASAGGLYPVQTYILVHDQKVDGLPSGTWYHDPSSHALVSIQPGSWLAKSRHAPPNRTLAASAAFSLFFVIDCDAIVPMYGQDAGLRFAALETGAMCQLLEEMASRWNLGLCQVGLQDGPDIAEMLRLGPSHQFIHAMVGGHVSSAQHDEAGLLRDASTYGKMQAAQDAETTTHALDPAVLRVRLAAFLPETMIPAWIEVLDALPLTPNGKVDHSALMHLAERRFPRTAPEGGTARSPSSAQALTGSHKAADPLEVVVESIWAQVLGLAEIPPGSNFFELGGTSLHLVRIQAKLEARLEKEVAIVDLFRLPRVRDVAEYLRDLCQDPQPSSPPAPLDSDDQARARGRLRAMAARRSLRGNKGG